jgi:hypothetical protein
MLLLLMVRCYCAGEEWRGLPPRRATVRVLRMDMFKKVRVNGCTLAACSVAPWLVVLAEEQHHI